MDGHDVHHRAESHMLTARIKPWLEYLSTLVDEGRAFALRQGKRERENR